MNVLKSKLVVYDSACPLCAGLRTQALRWNIISEEDCVSYAGLPAQYSAAVDPERFRNEMALVDRNGGRTLYGSEGLASVFSVRYPLLEPLFAMPSFRSLFRALYGVVAPNRYVLSTPRVDTAACACLAAGSRRDRLRYIGPGLLFSLAMTVLFAVAVRTLLPGHDWPVVVAAIALGWVVYMAVAAAVLRRIYMEFAAHMVSVMWRGTIVLTPVICTSLVTSAPVVLVPLTALCIVASFTYMTAQHRRRMQALCLRPVWTILWAVVLWSAFGAAVLWGMPGALAPLFFAIQKMVGFSMWVMS